MSPKHRMVQVIATLWEWFQERHRSRIESATQASSTELASSRLARRCTDVSI